MAEVTARRIAATLGGPRILKTRAPSFTRLQQQLRGGLPYASLETVMARFQIAREDIVVLLHLPLRTLARRKREARLRSDESDRLFRLSRIATLAEEVLGSPARASQWLHRPNRALGHAIPLRHLDTDLGARQVEDLLIRIGHGIFS